MIYFTNVKSNQPHLTFIGRWSPFHKGHQTLINTKRSENPELPVLIQVRATDYDNYPPDVRAKLIKIWMLEEKIKGTVMIIPDIEGVYWGRGVGYKTEKVDVDVTVQAISATKIRESISFGDDQWELAMANKNIGNMIQEKTSKIISDGLVLWFTGCPHAGKTTLSKALKKEINYHFPYIKIQVLDGDVIRSTPISEGVGFSQSDRALHIRRIGYLAKMFADHGILVITAFVSPDKTIRDQVAKIIGKRRYKEIYVKASLENRIKRDKNGIYQKAMRGEIKNLTGYNSEYDEPSRPFIVCDTDNETVAASTAKILNKLFR